MKYSKRKLWAAVPVVLAVGILITAPAPKVSAKVRMNKTSVYLKSGSKLKLKVYGRGKKKIRWWKSTKPSVATVTKKGTVKAVAGGTAYIKAKVGGRTVRSKIKVYGPTKSIVSLAPGKNYKVKVRYGRGTTFLKSYNKKVAKVSKSGKITAVAPGKTKILLKTRGKKIKMTVCVAKLASSSAQLQPGDTYAIQILGGGEPVQFSSSNPNVASVDANGLVRANAYGNDQIYCKTGMVTLTMDIAVVQRYVTDVSALPMDTRGDIAQVTVNAAGGSRTYTAFGQYDSNAGTTRVHNFIKSHGCGACAIAGTMTGLGISSDVEFNPTTMIEVIEPRVLGASWNENYTNTNGKMPISLLGISNVLSSYGVSNQYVQQFNDTTVVEDIKNHLYSGRPVIIEVSSKNRFTGITDKKWSNSKHTLALVGMDSMGRAIILDSANRSSFGTTQRIKYEYVESLIGYMFSNTRTAGSVYYDKEANSGGYILVNR